MHEAVRIASMHANIISLRQKGEEELNLVCRGWKRRAIPRHGSNRIFCEALSVSTKQVIASSNHLQENQVLLSLD